MDSAEKELAEREVSQAIYNAFDKGLEPEDLKALVESVWLTWGEDIAQAKHEVDFDEDTDGLRI